MTSEPSSAPAGGAVAMPATRPLSSRLAVPSSLLALYIIWGSTYLAIRIAVESIPPFYMSGIRFTLAGIVLYLFLRLRGSPNPTVRQWGGAAIVGALLLAGGNGMVAFAEKSVASGLAAIIIATVPLWAALFASLWGERPGRLEVLGLLLGFAGVGLLNTGSGLSGHPFAAMVLVFASLSWAFGSMWSRHLPMPDGMMASAVEMLTGGAIMMIVAVASGERFSAVPTARSIWAVIYLILFGSFIAYSAYVFLLRHVRPALATSYAYVNPVVAVMLGIAVAGEKITVTEVVALLVVLTAVALVLMGRERR